MNREKIELCTQIWKLGKILEQILGELAENPEDTSSLDALTTAVQTLQPYLSKDLMDRIVFLFSGAEIEPEDLGDAGQRTLDELSALVSKALLEQVNTCRYVERSEAEALFPLWDELHHVDANSYQWLFDLCLVASVSMPLEAFQYMLKLFEEQPGMLSEEHMVHPGYIYRPSEQHTFECCPICGGAGTPYYNALAYRMVDFSYPHLPVKLWMKCASCGNLFTWKYPEEHLTSACPKGIIAPNPAQALTATEDTNGLILAGWSDIFDRLSAYSSGKTLLEVGIGKGELLAVALELGYQPDAVEIDSEAAQKAADMLSIPIWCGDFLNYSSNKRYSIITMGDVIEHVTSPEKALKNACRLLEDDGVLWLSTPNFESSFSRMHKFEDAMWMEPHHISYFNRQGIEALAAKCGFVLREYHVSRRYNGSMELVFTKKGHTGLQE